MTDHKELIEQLRKPWTDVEYLQKLCAKAADALEAEQRVVVRQLVWEYHPVGTLAADNVGKAYIIDTRGGRVKFLKWPQGHTTEADTIDEAKAAAQADYERRILSALTLRPAAEVASSAQWDAFNRVLHWINEQDKKIMSKGDLYDAVMEMRPRAINAIHTAVTRAALQKLDAKQKQ